MGNNSTIMLSPNSLDLFSLPYNIINGKYKRYAVLPPFEIPKKDSISLLYGGGARIGAVVSLADNGPKGPWFETWQGRRSSQP